MPSIYKYLPERFVDNLLRGEVLFRTLSYFQDWEDKYRQVRGDRYEGTYLHQKPDGLDLTFNHAPEPTKLHGSFQSRVQSDDIFVFCLSTELSATLAHEFETTTCVEFHDPAKLIAGIRAALLRRPSVKSKRLLSEPVHYYDSGDQVGVKWALPDSITMSKTRDFDWQCEYRLAFAVNDAFSAGATQQAFVFPNGRWERSSSDYPEKLLKVGDLRRYCTVWQFAPDGSPVKRSMNHHAVLNPV